MNAIERLIKLRHGTLLQEDDQGALAAALELIHGVEIDNTAGNTGGDEDPARMVMGNVDDGTLRALGFDVPETPREKSWTVQIETTEVVKAVSEAKAVMAAFHRLASLDEYDLNATCNAIARPVD